MSRSRHQFPHRAGPAGDGIAYAEPDAAPLPEASMPVPRYRDAPLAGSPRQK